MSRTYFNFPNITLYATLVSICEKNLDHQSCFRRCVVDGPYLPSYLSQRILITYEDAFTMRLRPTNMPSD